MTIRLGLIGVNNQGQEHIQASQHCSEVSFTAAFDINQQVLKDLREQYPDIQTYHTAEDFFTAEVDGYVLALPHHVYETIWSDLMSQGKPLLKEKPLGRNLKEAASFLQACQQHQIPLVTAIQRRTHSSYEYLKRLLTGETITALSATLHLGFDPTEKPASWRGVSTQAGGGALLDSGYHMIDLVFYFLSHFNLIDANVWFNGQLGTAEMLDTDASLVGRSGQTWVRIESRVGGEQKDGRYQKKELIEIQTESGLFEANREWVKRNGDILFECSRKWTDAMVMQLEEFGRMIHTGAFEQPKVWDQVAIMEVVEKAYAIAAQKAPFKGGYDA